MIYIDKESLTKIVNKNKQYLAKLKKLQKYSQEDFLTDWRVYSSGERYLHLALESMLDVGKKTINQLDLEKPDSYADIPRILSENKIIPVEEMEKYQELAKFRNALVHDYLYLDHKEIYKHLQQDPENIKKFIQFIQDYIKNQTRGARQKLNTSNNSKKKS